jgi:putative ABC transport system permease protein
MKTIDLIALIFENLARRKARVALTAVGVIIGTAAVVILVSLGVGLQRNAAEQLGGIGDLTLIHVYPNYGEFGSLDDRAGTSAAQSIITDQSLAEMRAIPGVAAVIPRDSFQGGVQFYVGRLEGWGQILGAEAEDLQLLGLKAKGGELTLSRGAVVVGSMVAHGFYDPHYRPGQEPPQPPDLLDQQLKISFIKWTNDGAEVRKNVQARVVGVLAESRSEADWSVFMPADELVAHNTWVLGRRLDRKRDGYPAVIVKVNSVDYALEVTDQIVALGYQAYTPQSFVQGINSFFIVLQIIFGGVGAISLLVAAIGIANTMAMAILERTREIGLMKAVGATNRDVLSVFLGEAAGIGFLGGLGGVVAGWLVGQVLNALALAYFAGQSVQTGAPPPTVAVYTPLWLPLFTLIFATVIGLLSGLYPALSAATLVPVAALKYE